MLGSVVQVHLSPPRTRFKKSSNVQKPALLPVRARVFCFSGAFQRPSTSSFLGGARLGACPQAAEMDAPKMPKVVRPLSDIQVNNAKPKDKPYKLAGGGGLYLEGMSTGSKLWRMKFKQTNGNESRLAFGAYPEVSLVEARSLLAELTPPRPSGSKRKTGLPPTPISLKQWHANGTLTNSNRGRSAPRQTFCTGSKKTSFH